MSEIPTLYHGTSNHRARSILASGFKRATGTGSYTGSATCLSEHLSIALPYGDYRAGGCVLAVTLQPNTRFQEVPMGLGRPDYDQWFMTEGAQALKTFCGNVWLLWDSGCIHTMRRLDCCEAIAIMVREFAAEGPEVAYNYPVQGYADAWWRKSPTIAPDTYEHKALMRLKAKAQSDSSRTT